jgi:ELWxxDGT repeat protein
VRRAAKRKTLYVIENSARYYGSSRPDHDATASSLRATGLDANQPTGGIELWETKGTVTGNAPVKDINPGTAGSTRRFLTRRHRRWCALVKKQLLNGAHTDFARVRNCRGPRQRRRGSRRRGGVAAEGLEHWPSRRSLHGPCEPRAPGFDESSS